MAKTISSIGNSVPYIQTPATATDAAKEKTTNPHCARGSVVVEEGHRRGAFQRILTTVLIVLAFVVPARIVLGGATADQWTQIGRGIIGGSGAHNISGRILQAAWRKDILQGNQPILWMGTHWGGLWKSIINSDGSISTWVPLTENFPGQHDMGSFLVNRANSKKIIIGIGHRGTDSDGDGSIYLTDDQGETWQKHRLPKHRAKSVTRLVDDRSDPDGNIVLAATSSGIYRTENFGAKWNLVFDGAEVTDVVQDAGDPSRWYAAALIQNVVLRSTNNGKTWKPFAPGGDRITGSVGRVSLAACESDPSVLYALAVDGEAGGTLIGLYRTMDRGQNWTKIFDENDVVNDDIQGLHTCAIGCDPTNPNHIFFGLRSPLETFTATLPPHAISWIGRTDSEHRSTLDAGHADYNYILFRHGDPSIVVTNDGGYYIYTPDPNGAGAGTVDDSGNLLGIDANFLKVSNGGLASSRIAPNLFIGGIGDNGVIIGDTGLNILRWSQSGDGGQGSIMPDDPFIMAASTNGDTARYESIDAGQSWFNINQGLEKQNFSSVLIDPTPGIDAPNIFTPALDATGRSSVVYRSVFDPTFADWNTASPHSLEGVIDHLDHTTDADLHEIIVTLEHHRRLVAYSGPRSDLGHLSLMNITPKPLHALTNKIHDASANADKSGLQPDTIYYTTGQSRPSQAFISIDGGQHWGEVTGDMPHGTNGPDFLKLIGNPKNPFQLFLATSRGVYRSDTEGLHWYRYSEGLRLNEEVDDIVINVHGLDAPLLYIGTYGRGFWQRIVN